MAGAGAAMASQPMVPDLPGPDSLAPENKAAISKRMSGCSGEDHFHGETQVSKARPGPHTY
jgi:hypothetical protein